MTKVIHGHGSGRRGLHELRQELATIFDRRLGRKRLPPIEVVSLCCSKAFPINCWNPEEPQETERRLFLGGVRSEGS